VSLPGAAKVRAPLQAQSLRPRSAPCRRHRPCAEFIPEALHPVYFFVTSPVAIMIGAALALVFIAVFLSPSSDEQIMTDAERAEVDAKYREHVARQREARGGDDDDLADDDEGEYTDDEDDEGIAEDDYDPATGKHKVA